MKRTYEIAGHYFEVLGENLCALMDTMAGFSSFLVEEGDVLFSLVEGEKAPFMQQEQYVFEYENVCGRFGKYECGYLLTLCPDGESPLYMWWDNDKKEICVQGNYSLRLYRFALWVAYGLMTLPYDTMAIHSSCVVYKNRSVLFLGESGTGKSTHTRLWRENIDGATLLNDDSPILRIEDGHVWAYGSPWSGKTPCYKNERYELKACVRLSQFSSNNINKLTVLQSYGAIHPSCPPEFAYDGVLYDHVSRFIDKLLRNVSFYHLRCLPDRDACILSRNTIFGE